MVYINVLIISCICVIVTDLTDFWSFIKKIIWKMMFKNRPYKEFSFKLLDCSLCQTWWLGLICLLVMGQFSLINIGYVLLIAYLTPVLCNFFILVKEFGLKFIDWWYNILHIE